MRFDDKVIFITGGGSGLGRECALWWAEAGGTIVVTDIVEKRATDVAAEISGKGGTAIGLRVDVSRESEVAAAVDQTVERFGRLDIMFANAGKVQAGAGALTLDELTDEQFDDVVDVVFKGVFYCGKHAARVMKPAGGGNIVVTISASGLNAYPGFGAYGAGKTGAMGLVRSMAYEFGRFGVRCNALAPTHGMSINFMLDPFADVARDVLRGGRPRAERRHLGPPADVPRAAEGRPAAVAAGQRRGGHLPRLRPLRVHVRRRDPLVRRGQLRAHVDPDPRGVDPGRSGHRPFLTRRRRRSPWKRLRSPTRSS